MVGLRSIAGAVALLCCTAAPQALLAAPSTAAMQARAVA
jgi:hypothetical protein